MPTETKSLGQAIDEIVGALTALDENARLIAVKAACDTLGINNPGIGFAVPIAHPPMASSGTTVQSAGGDAGSYATVDIRSLKDQKRPATSFEMACLVAYYLRSIAQGDDRKDAITTVDLEKYFRQAEYPLPKKIGQVLIDAKAAGYFDSAGRGSYKLNAVGHNLVVHKLPRSSDPANSRNSRQGKKQVAGKKKSGRR